MFSPATFHLHSVKDNITQNIEYVSEYISSQKAFVNGERDEYNAQIYIQLLKDVKSCVELMLMQEKTLLTIAKQNTEKYHDSLNFSPRTAHIQVNKEKYYNISSNSRATRLHFHLVIENEDGIVIDDRSRYLGWKERGNKKKIIEELINIAVNEHNVTSDISIDDYSNKEE